MIQLTKKFNFSGPWSWLSGWEIRTILSYKYSFSSSFFTKKFFLSLADFDNYDIFHRNLPRGTNPNLSSIHQQG